MVNYTIVKQPITCSNCGKIVCAKKPCHNMKIKEPIIPFVSTKVAKLVAEITTQLVKARVPLKYPCIIYFNSEHHAPNCPRKKKIQLNQPLPPL